MKSLLWRSVIFFSLLFCVGCSQNNKGIQYGEAEESVSNNINIELKKILESDMNELMETQDFQISNDKFIHVFSPEYYSCAEAENSDFYLICTSYYNEDQPPAYIAFNEEYIEEYLEEIGLKKGMNFSDIMEVWGDSDVFETSYDDTAQKKYKIEYEREGLRYLFVSDYPIPSDDEIKKYLNMTVEELENLTESKVEKMLSILPFPVLYSRNTSYWFVCNGWDTGCKPMYLVFYEECEEEYLRQHGLKNAADFSDILEIMGNTEVVVSRTGEEIKDRVGDCTYYKIEYERDGLQYAFIAEEPDGKNFTLYISLATSDMEDQPEETIDTELDNSDRAMMLYKEFLSGDRNVKGISNIDDITTPIGETDRHYFTKYAYCDSNGDTIPELHIKSGKYYFVISYEDNDLFVWKDLSAYNSEYYPLSNGAFLMRKDDVQASPGVSYRYSVFNIKGDEISGFSFSKANINQCTGYDEGDEYLYDGISISQEMWEKLTKRYVYQDNKGNLIIADDLNWITLYEK